jgi:hypothetical protein
MAPSGQRTAIIYRRTTSAKILKSVQNPFRPDAPLDHRFQKANPSPTSRGRKRRCRGAPLAEPVAEPLSTASVALSTASTKRRRFGVQKSTWSASRCFEEIRSVSQPAAYPERQGRPTAAPPHPQTHPQKKLWEMKRTCEVLSTNKMCKKDVPKIGSRAKR